MRVFALANNIWATNTVRRIKQVAPLINLSSANAAALIDAFNFIQHLRLRHQHFDQQEGRESDNFVRPDDLNEVERRILKEAFRQARKIQQQLKLDYQL